MRNRRSGPILSDWNYSRPTHAIAFLNYNLVFKASLYDAFGVVKKVSRPKSEAMRTNAMALVPRATGDTNVNMLLVYRILAILL